MAFPLFTIYSFQGDTYPVWY